MDVWANDLALVAGGSQHAGISTNLKFVICDKYSRMLRLILFGREFQYTHIWLKALALSLSDKQHGLIKQENVLTLLIK